MFGMVFNRVALRNMLAGFPTAFTDGNYAIFEKRFLKSS
jgi:hypothetical protein